MPFHLPRCMILPLPDDRVSIRLDGVERLQWHFGANAPRPFFYPLVGPSGTVLTRMGHPGAENHDHHRSVWFAHNKVLGIDFWSDRTEARIRQQNWLMYEDGDDEAVMACRLGWYDGHEPSPLLTQDVIAVARLGENKEFTLQLQSTFVPTAESLEFGQTNFGFLAVRVAKHLSEFFGGGRLTNSENQIAEANLFGRRAVWVDYSGPVPGQDDWEGITYFDHPSNPGYPAHWHVREDGWMGASPGMHSALTTSQAEPLRLTYLLHIHRGKVAPNRAANIAVDFANRPKYEVVKSRKKHQQYEIERVSV